MLLLQQHKQVVCFFNEYTSCCEEINHKLLHYTARSSSSIKASSSPSSKVDEQPISSPGHSISESTGSPVSPRVKKNRAVTRAGTGSMTSWSKQLEQEEMRDKEAADAMCKSSGEFDSESTFAKSSSCCRNRLAACVHSSIFESFVSIAIFTNAIVIGVETQYMAKSQREDIPTALKVVGWFYGLIFLTEVALRLICEGRRFFVSRLWTWNLFDLFCAICSVFEVIVDAIDWGSTLQNGNVVRIARLVRTLRLSRTIRITSVVRFVGALQILVQSITATLKSLVWALVLMCIIVYICGIMFTQAATNHVIETGEEDNSDVLEYWGTLGTSMYTLYQSVTGGLSWRDAALPLARLSWLWESLFTAYVSFTYFAVLNVITGVFCNSAIENARHEPDMIIQSFVADHNWYENHLKELFRNLDKDKSGRISIRELEKSISNASVRAWFAAMGIEVADAWTLFKLIDEDRSHDVSAPEFVERCMQLKGNARSLDLALLRHEHRMTTKKLMQMAGRIEDQFQEGQQALRTIGTSIQLSSSIGTDIKGEGPPPGPLLSSSNPVSFLQPIKPLISDL